MESARTRKGGIFRHSPRRQSGYTSDPYTAPSRTVSTGSAVIPLFYNMNRTHTHRRITRIQHVGLYDAYLLSFLIDTFHHNGIRTSCHALIRQGLHCTHTMATKSDHLLGRSAPRTYSIICISSESCLGSIVGFARLPCFGTLCSAISAKVALGELLRLCPGSSGRAPQ